jgi:hypothetical protein
VSGERGGEERGARGKKTAAALSDARGPRTRRASLASWNPRHWLQSADQWHAPVFGRAELASGGRRRAAGEKRGGAVAAPPLSLSPTPLCSADPASCGSNRARPRAPVIQQPSASSSSCDAPPGRPPSGTSAFFRPPCLLCFFSLCLSLCLLWQRRRELAGGAGSLRDRGAGWKRREGGEGGGSGGSSVGGGGGSGGVSGGGRRRRRQEGRARAAAGRGLGLVCLLSPRHKHSHAVQRLVRRARSYTPTTEAARAAKGLVGKATRRLARRSPPPPFAPRPRFF